MEKHPDKYSQYEQFGPAHSQKPQKAQYHEVIGFPANSDQPQPYVPTYQWLPRSGVTQKPNQQQGYAPATWQHSQAPVGQKQYQQRVPQASVAQKPKPPKPMPKARALALVDKMKKSLVVVSLAAFVSFGGLAAFHQVGVSANKTASTSSTSSTTSTSSQSSSKNFLKQTGGSNTGTSSSSSGTSSGTSGSSSTGSSSSTSQGSSSSTSSTGSSSSSSSPAVSGSGVS